MAKMLTSASSSSARAWFSVSSRKAAAKKWDFMDIEGPRRPTAWRGVDRMSSGTGWPLGHVYVKGLRSCSRLLLRLFLLNEPRRLVLGRGALEAVPFG
jgi:hypothetical protein